ncbi:hypothetical protein AAF712_003794 [Marasmius tenuissimus]|uniref:Uncharacterized protein n=1 Tax=Marasmius tenuissimus TaxID=585030 RepID=A0ABR3A7Y5_9AGAR
MLNITKFNLKSQFSGFALLYNPIYLGKRNTIVVFNAQVDMSPENPDANNIIKGFVRYYKGEDHRDYPESSQFFVNMKIAQIPETSLTVREDEDSVEVSSTVYDFIGDINMFFDTDQPDETRFHPTVDICGVASKIDHQNATFNLKTSQYLQIGSKKFTFPTHIVIPDSPKFVNIGKDRVLPSNENTYVSVTGFLTRVITKPGVNGEDGPVQAFCVDVDSTSNLGRPPPNSISAKETPVQVKNTSGSKRKRVPMPTATPRSNKAPKTAPGTLAGTSRRTRQAQGQGQHDDVVDDEASSSGEQG